MKTIVIVMNPNDCPPKEADRIGTLVEFSPDGQMAERFKNMVTYLELTGGVDELRVKASHFANKILKDEVCFRGVAHLALFKEDVIAILVKTFQVIHLNNYLKANQYDICIFLNYSWYAEELAKLVKFNGEKLEVRYPEAPKKHLSLINKYIKYFLSIRKLGLAFKLMFDRVDPYHKRHLLFSYFKPKKVYKENEVWFFTTSHNYTKIGLEYEPYFGGRFNFLIENPLDGGQLLKEKDMEYYFLYDFSKFKFIPSKAEIKLAVEKIKTHILTVPLSDDEVFARKSLLADNWMILFFKRLLRVGLYQTSIFEHWVNTAKPKAVVVGNPVWEGYAMHAAHERKIPTFLLQHGLFGDFYHYIDYGASYTIVRGEFWKDFLFKSARKRALVVNNTTIYKNTQPATSTMPRIVLLANHLSDSGPLYSAALLNAKEAIYCVAKVANRLKAHLTIRFHPRENTEDYQSIINSLLIPFRNTLNLQYEKGTEIELSLKGASVCVSFMSTVFLDCLNLGIPVISVGWQRSSMHDSIEPLGAFNFATSLSDLERLIEKAIEGSLGVKQDKKEYFLANTDFNASKSLISKIIDN